AGQSLLIPLPPAAAGAAPRRVMCALLRDGQRILATLCLAREAGQPDFDDSDLRWADALALAASPSLAALADIAERQERLFLKTLTAMTQLVHLRDDRTGSHGQRTTDYALMLADVLGLPEAQKHCLRIGTPLHDLGKIGLPDAVLQKPGKLTAEE